jgi:hypothetical protein
VRSRAARIPCERTGSEPSIVQVMTLSLVIPSFNTVAVHLRSPKACCAMLPIEPSEANCLPTAPSLPNGPPRLSAVLPMVPPADMALVSIALRKVTRVGGRCIGRRNTGHGPTFKLLSHSASLVKHALLEDALLLPKCAAIVYTCSVLSFISDAFQLVLSFLDCTLDRAFGCAGSAGCLEWVANFYFPPNGTVRCKDSCQFRSYKPRGEK